MRASSNLARDTKTLLKHQKMNKLTDIHKARSAISDREYFVMTVAKGGSAISANIAFSVATNPVSHATYSEAEKEAVRLANAYPGTYFVVAQFRLGCVAGGLELL